MAASKNLKVNVIGDTSSFTQAMNQAKGDLKSFSAVSSDALKGVGDLIGVNVGQIDKYASAVRGLGGKLNEMGGVSESVFGKMLSSLTGVKAGIAGVAVAGLIAAFKSLHNEAENFKTTVQGASIELGTAAWIDTYNQAMHDFVGTTGKAVAESESKWSKFFSTIGNNIKWYFRSGQFGMDQMNNDSLTSAAISGKYEYNNNYSLGNQEANEKAAEAERIAKRIYEIDRAISAEQVKIAQTGSQISKLRVIANTEANKLSDRQNAINEAYRLAESRYTTLVALESEKAELMKRANDLTSSTPQQIDAANAQEIKAVGLIRAKNDALRELLEKQNSITKLVNKEKDDREAMAKLRESFSQTVEGMKGLQSLEANAPSGVDSKLGQVTEVQVMLNTDIAKQQIVDLSKNIQDVLSSAFVKLGEIVGSFVGDLINGDDAFSNLFQNAATALADLAIKIGSIAIAIGTTLLAIKAGLLSLNPWVMIGAGVALIALGAIAKTAISNAASGQTSTATATSGASSSGSYQGATYDNSYRENSLQVEVVGQLRADGNQLVAVIENNNNRKQHTT